MITICNYCGIKRIVRTHALRCTFYRFMIVKSATCTRTGSYRFDRKSFARRIRCHRQVQPKFCDSTWTCATSFGSRAFECRTTTTFSFDTLQTQTKLRCSCSFYSNRSEQPDRPVCHHVLALNRFSRSVHITSISGGSDGHQSFRFRTRSSRSKPNQTRQP